MRISDWSSDVCSSDLGRYERRRIEVAVWTFIMSKHVGPTATDSDLNSLDGIKNDQPQALPLSRTGPEQETYRAAAGSPVGKGGLPSWKLRPSIVAARSILFSPLLRHFPLRPPFSTPCLRP